MLKDYFIEFSFINITIYHILYIINILPHNDPFQMFQQNLKSSISYNCKG